MTRHKDSVWTLPDQPTYEGAQLAVLMDIRDELKKLNALLNCGNFTSIPDILRSIRRNTTKRRYTKKQGKG